MFIDRLEFKSESLEINSAELLMNDGQASHAT